MRIPFISGNHKMNKTLSEAVEYSKNLIDRVKNVKPSDAEIMIAPTFTSLSKLAEIFKGSNIKLGAQNCHYEKNGAFTGEISIDMLKNIGVDYVIIGHSERRHIFNESNELLNKKAKAVLKSELKLVFCIGEKEEEREAGITNSINEIQLRTGMKGISKDYANNIIIAYEPVWAIGTGKTATPDDAQNAHIYIRKILSDIFGEKNSETMRILYGGSVKPENIKELMSQKDIDGVLVGGASLKFDSFERIIKFNS